MSMTVKQVATDFLNDALEDYVGLWALIWRVREQMRETDPGRIRDITMAILSDLLHRKLIKAGMPDSNGEFEQWEGSPDLIIARIAKEWSQLGHEPNLGEVAWFTSTD